MTTPTYRKNKKTHSFYCIYGTDCLEVNTVVLPGVMQATVKAAYEETEECTAHEFIQAYFEALAFVVDLAHEAIFHPMKTNSHAVLAS